MDINITTSLVKFSLLRVTDLKKSYTGRQPDSIIWNEEEQIWNTNTNTWDD